MSKLNWFLKKMWINVPDFFPHINLLAKLLKALGTTRAAQEVVHASTGTLCQILGASSVSTCNDWLLPW